MRVRESIFIQNSNVQPPDAFTFLCISLAQSTVDVVAATLALALVLPPPPLLVSRRAICVFEAPKAQYGFTTFFKYSQSATGMSMNFSSYADPSLGMGMPEAPGAGDVSGVFWFFSHSARRSTPSRAHTTPIPLWWSESSSNMTRFQMSYVITSTCAS